MAIIREQIVNDNEVNYVATLAFFCGISCTILMLRFGGFKANFNLITGKRVKSEYYDEIPTVSSTTGAYRTNRDELYRNGSISDPPKKLDPSMVKLPSSSQAAQSKSTDNLSQAVNKLAVVPPNLAKSTPNVSMNPQGESIPNVPNVTSPVSNLKYEGNELSNLAKSTPNVSSIHKGQTVNKVQESKVSKDKNKVTNPPNLAKSTPNVSLNHSQSSVPNVTTVPKGPVKNQGSAQVLDKKGLAAQKKAEKLAAQERAKQEKLRKQQEEKQEKERKQMEAKQAKERKIQEAQQEKQRKRDEKVKKQEEAKKEKDRKTREKLESQQAKKNKGKANSNPLAQPRMNPLAQGSQQPTINAIPQPPPLPSSKPPERVSESSISIIHQPPSTSQFSTNTLESSISKASGPPPYSEITQKVENKNDNSGNTSFGKPVQELSTWDMVSQHRQEISRPRVAGGARKQTVLDLEYTAQTGRKSVYI